MQKEKQLKASALKLAENLPAWQAETVIQLLEALEEAGRRNAAMVEAINWVVSPGRWIQREENIWEWRESPRGDFLKVLCQVVTEPDQLKGDHHGL